MCLLHISQYMNDYFTNPETVTFKVEPLVFPHFPHFIDIDRHK